MKSNESIGERAVELANALEEHDSVVESGAYGSAALGHWQFAAVEPEGVPAVERLAEDYGFKESDPDEDLASASDQFQHVREAAREEELEFVCFVDGR